MCWIGSLTSSGHITEALIHFNQASDRLKGEASAVEVSRSFFDALNKTQTEWVLHEEDRTMGEVKAFQTMILKGLDRKTRIQLLQSGEMKNFVCVNPQIMNHGTLKRHHYRPDVEVETRLVKKATEEHHKLSTAYSDFLSNFSFR